MDIVYRARTTAVVRVTCEACEHVFTYRYTLFGDSESPGYEGAMGELEAQVRDKCFGTRRCPACGYFQSWMVEQLKSRTFMRLRLMRPVALLAVSAVLCGLVMWGEPIFKFAVAIPLPDSDWFALVRMWLVLLVFVMPLVVVLPVSIYLTWFLWRSGAHWFFALHKLRYAEKRGRTLQMRDPEVTFVKPEK